MTAAGTQVVFGTGPARRAVADTLIRQGTRVRMVNQTRAPVLTSRTDVTARRRPMPGALGLFNRNVRELLHTHHQFAAPFVVDDTAFRDAFGGHTTPSGDIVASTVSWYRAHATQPEFFPGLAEATTLKVTAS